MILLIRNLLDTPLHVYKPLEPHQIGINQFVILLFAHIIRLYDLPAPFPVEDKQDLQLDDDHLSDTVECHRISNPHCAMHVRSLDCKSLSRCPLRLRFLVPFNLYGTP
jgi:hypothetical protein